MSYTSGSLLKKNTIEQLKNVLNSFAPIPEQDWNLMKVHLFNKKLLQGEYMIKEGDRCDEISFILSGSLRAFYVDSNNEEINLLLYPENQFMTEYESIITQKPAVLNIQALEDTELVFFSRAVLYQLYDQSFYWNKIGRLVAEHVFLECKTRAEELLLLTPEQRYLTLMDTKPYYFQRFALKHISSYLGITPQSLSRIRARLTTIN